MNYEYAVQEHEGYLKVTMSGVVTTAADMLILAEHIIPEALQRGCKRVVVDESGIVERLSVVDLVAGAEMVTEYIAERGVKVASVRSGENMTTGWTFETLLRSRKMNYKVFDNQEEAVSWVMKESGVALGAVSAGQGMSEAVA